MHESYPGTQSTPRRTLLSRLSPWPEVAFYTPVAGIVAYAGVRARRGEYDTRRWFNSAMAIVRSMEGVGMRATVEGQEHLTAFEGPAVFVSNHMSTLETFVLPAIIRPVKPMTFVVKQSLMEYPLFGDVLRSLDVIVLSRKNARKDLKVMMEQGRDRLNHGISVVVFPQTTRSTTFDASQFNSIGCKLAARNGVPVVPVALRTDAWGIGERSKDIGRIDPSLPVHFRIGAPIWPQARGNQTHHRAVEFIEATLGEWGVPVA